MATSTFDLVGNHIDEGKITEFMGKNKKLIKSYSYRSAWLGSVLGDIYNGDTWYMGVSGASGYGEIYPGVTAIDENFLDTAFDQYYIPSQI